MIKNQKINNQKKKLKRTRSMMISMMKIKMKDITKIRSMKVREAILRMMVTTI